MAKKEIAALQVLRGLAALAVVCHHAFRAVAVNQSTDLGLPVPFMLHNPILIEIGAMGVDIFFVLSGFLMMHISRPYVMGEKSIGDFLMLRIVRIWPLYVVMTAIVLVLSFRVGIRYDFAPVRLLSFVFIPSFNMSGLLQPILGVGWTLNYEAFFYLVFAAVLWLMPRALFVGLALTIAAFFFGSLLLPLGYAARDFFANSVIFEFVLGAAIGSAHARGRIPFPNAKFWLLAAALTLAIMVRFPADGGARILVRGVPAAMFFVGMLYASPNKGWAKPLIALGDASYSIYLVHILVIYQISPPALRWSVRHGFSGVAAEAVALISIVSALLVGLACYFVLERRLLTASKRFVGRLQAQSSRTTVRV